VGRFCHTVRVVSREKVNGPDVTIVVVSYILAHVALDVIVFSVLSVQGSLVYIAFLANALIALAIAVQLVKADRRHRRPD
jgi:hypothetical protein